MFLQCQAEDFGMWFCAFPPFSADFFYGSLCWLCFWSFTDSSSDLHYSVPTHCMWTLTVTFVTLNLSYGLTCSPPIPFPRTDQAFSSTKLHLNDSKSAPKKNKFCIHSRMENPKEMRSFAQRPVFWLRKMSLIYSWTLSNPGSTPTFPFEDCTHLKCYLLISKIFAVLCLPWLLREAEAVCIPRPWLSMRMLRKLGPPCHLSLGQCCYADVLWSMVIKTRRVCDQRTCWVVSAPLVPYVAGAAASHLSDTDECIFHIKLH